MNLAANATIFINILISRMACTGSADMGSCRYDDFGDHGSVSNKDTSLSRNDMKRGRVYGI